MQVNTFINTYMTKEYFFQVNSCVENTFFGQNMRESYAF